MDGIRAIKREKNLTAIAVEPDDAAIGALLASEQLRGLIKPAAGRAVAVLSGTPPVGCEVVSRELCALTISGDSMQGKDQRCAEIMSILCESGICETFVSVSEIGMTLYLHEPDADRAWRRLAEMIE